MLRSPGGLTIFWLSKFVAWIYVAASCEILIEGTSLLSCRYPLRVEGLFLGGRITGIWPGFISMIRLYLRTSNKFYPAEWGIWYLLSDCSIVLFLC